MKLIGSLETADMFVYMRSSQQKIKMSRFGRVYRLLQIQPRICLEDWKRYAGHNKWANIRHIKASKDSQKATLFWKLNRQLRLAVQEGSSADPNLNSKLQQVIEQARRQSMPMASIQNAIKLAASSKADMKEYLMEVAGPGGSLILVVLLTDNFQKDKCEIAPIVRKCKVAAMSEGGRWRHTFDLRSVVEVLRPAGTTLEAAVGHAIQAGAEDVDEVEVDEAMPALQFSCGLGQTRQVEAELVKLGYKVHFAGQKYVPRGFVELSEDAKELLGIMYQKLEDHQDVMAIYDNIA